MKVILFRFEKEKINFLECEINSGELILGEKGKISLEGTSSSGEKYKKIGPQLIGRVWFYKRPFEAARC